MNDSVLHWNTKFINNIESNGIDCYYAITEALKVPRLYRITTQKPFVNNSLFVCKAEDAPQYYILWETIKGERFQGDANPVYSNSWKDESSGLTYKFDSAPALVAVYTSLTEAKARAMIQIEQIQKVFDEYFMEKHQLEGRSFTGVTVVEEAGDVSEEECSCESCKHNADCVPSCEKLQPDSINSYIKTAIESAFEYDAKGNGTCATNYYELAKFLIETKLRRKQNHVR